MTRVRLSRYLHTHSTLRRREASKRAGSATSSNPTVVPGPQPRASALLCGQSGLVPSRRCEAGLPAGERAFRAAIQLPGWAVRGDRTNQRRPRIIQRLRTRARLGMRAGGWLWMKPWSHHPDHVPRAISLTSNPLCARLARASVEFRRSSLGFVSAHRPMVSDGANPRLTLWRKCVAGCRGSGGA